MEEGNHTYYKKLLHYSKIAFAGSRTRVYCLEGNYPNRWTTKALCSRWFGTFLIRGMLHLAFRIQCPLHTDAKTESKQSESAQLWEYVAFHCWKKKPAGS